MSAMRPSVMRLGALRSSSRNRSRRVFLRGSAVGGADTLGGAATSLSASAGAGGTEGSSCGSTALSPVRRIDERAPLAGKLERDAHLGSLLDDGHHARLDERSVPADQLIHRDAKRLALLQLHGLGHAGGHEEQLSPAAQVDEVQIVARPRRDTSILEDDRLLEGEERLLTEVG